MLGALVGVLLAALGQLVGSFPLGATVVVAAGACLGAFACRLKGEAAGAMCGALAAAFGSVIGGTSLGTAFTVLACALLGGWLTWVRQRGNGNHGPRATESKSAREMGRLFRMSQLEPVHVRWLRQEREMSTCRS
jgi:hypothetical protein